VEPSWLDSAGPPTHFTKSEVDKSQDVMQKYDVGYDNLIIAVGCYSATFGTPGVSEYNLSISCSPLTSDSGVAIRSLSEGCSRCSSYSEQDAVRNIFPSRIPAQAICTIRERFEQALLPNLNDDQRRNLLQFSLVGGGPTGVEFAAELHDFISEDVYRMYPTLKGLVGIRVYDVAPGILMSFDK
jgi:NADH dehydrogenase FAD-containing subunit